MGRRWHSCMETWFSGLHPHFSVVQSVAVLQFGRFGRRRVSSCIRCFLQETILVSFSWHDHDPVDDLYQWIEMRTMMCDMSGDAAAGRSAVSRQHIMPRAIIKSLYGLSMSGTVLGVCDRSVMSLRE